MSPIVVVGICLLGVACIGVVGYILFRPLPGAEENIPQPVEELPVEEVEVEGNEPQEDTEPQEDAEPQSETEEN